MAIDEPERKHEVDGTVNHLPPSDYPVATYQPSESVDWRPEQRICDGHYQVDHRIGAEGAMGKVYLVHSVDNPDYRFAVKRTKRLDDYNRKQFLTELQTWIDLPAHPHIVTCRFFRTVDDEVLIFSDYIDGGSLQNLIDQKELSIEQILDIAIQFAWGLHAAHELGLVHQDVKPSNALITNDGLVKVCDFGIARARYFSGQEPEGEPGDRRFTYRGRTPLYCSPEQATEDDTLTRQSDIWSWGVSVLQMFSKEICWESGETADAGLENYLRTGASNGSEPLPDDVAAILRRCLRRNVAERWATFLETAEALVTAYRQVTEKDYSRLMPRFLRSAERAAAAHDRRTSYGVEWVPAANILARALAAAGQDVDGATKDREQIGATRKGQATSELAGYDEAKRIYERLIGGGQLESREALAFLCVNKALLHEHLDDMAGALAEYDRALEIREELVQREGRRELANDLAMTHVNKAVTLQKLSQHEAAITEVERAIALLESPQYANQAAVGEKLLAAAQRVKREATEAKNLTTMYGTSRPTYIPRPQFDAEKAMRRNIEYREALKAWNALSWWQRRKTPKPEPRSDT